MEWNSRNLNGQSPKTGTRGFSSSSDFALLAAEQPAQDPFGLLFGLRSRRGLAPDDGFLNWPQLKDGKSPIQDQLRLGIPYLFQVISKIAFVNSHSGPPEQKVATSVDAARGPVV
jgi:hypothetical protein